jgi:hypothetical protein
MDVDTNPTLTGSGAVDKQAEDRRFPYGPRPLAALLPAVVRPAFRRRAPATAQIFADWPAIVGPALAATTTPRRLSAGTLTIGCTGPVAIELQHLTAEVTARINSHFGRPLVGRLRFAQEPASRPAARPSVDPPPQASPLAEHAIADLPEGPLRNALAALGGVVLQAPSTAPDRRR